jgi:ribosomal protein S18 acetylase RimI-like enzyme
LIPSNKIILEEATSQTQLALARDLFLEYASSLEISLGFQDFEAELAALPGKYTRPSGRLLLGCEGGQTSGCVALRQLEPGVCEMKRLYIRPSARGKGLGRLLAEAIITAANEIGYERMRLDTLNSMEPALCLYHSLGFRQIKPYYANPDERAVFMELALRQPAPTSWTAHGKAPR